MKTAIPYYRVSTRRQGKSGLGLDAQQAAVKDYARRHDLVLMHEFTEVESGKKNSRPKLAEAINQCRKEKAILLIAKLDRLARNVAFVSTLMETKVEFIAVDNPYASKLVIHIMAAFAEHERDEISRRTKDALQAAKRRGVMLGRHGREVLASRNRMAADKFAMRMKPIIAELQGTGFRTMRKMSDELTRRQIPTSRGDTKWHNTTVFNILHRINRIDSSLSSS